MQKSSCKGVKILQSQLIDPPAVIALPAYVAAPCVERRGAAEIVTETAPLGLRARKA